MVIQPRFDAHVLEIKTRDTIVRLGDTIQVGEMTLPGPGEYEIAGVMVDNTASAARIDSEDMRIVYVTPTDKKLSEHELEQLGATHIAIVNMNREEWGVKDLVTLMTQIEAPIVIPLIFDDTRNQEIIRSVPTAEQLTTPFKISRSQVIGEGTRVIVFTKGTGQ